MPRGRTDTRLVGNIDVPATILDATDVAPNRPLDGRSLLELLADGGAEWGRDILIENGNGANGVPTYRGIRTYRFLYVDHRTTGEYELYDLVEDPFELQSLDGHERYRKVQRDSVARPGRSDVRRVELPHPPAARCVVRSGGRPVSGCVRKGLLVEVKRLEARSPPERRRARGPPSGRAVGGPAPARPPARPGRGGAPRGPRRHGPSACACARRPRTAAAIRSTARCAPADDRRGAAGRGVAGREPATSAERPNVIVLMTDDQTVESLRAMPAVRGSGGRRDDLRALVRLEPAVLPVASHLPHGQYSHNHGVLDNDRPRGLRRLGKREWLPVWLQRAGYHTVHIGKFLNGYGIRSPPRCRPAGTSGTRRWTRPPTATPATRSTRTAG